MIGDSAADIQLGRAYGATTLWCAWGYLDEPGEVPDFRAGAPRELPGIVRRCLADPSAISHRAQP